MKFQGEVLDYRVTCPYPVSIINPLVNTDGFSRMYVGCGKCGACLHNRRVDWSFRIQEEAKHSDTCYFVTLTYHDSVIPYTTNGLRTLHKRDMQLFNKRLRKTQSSKTNAPLRFFCVGEYGTLYERPHYHVIYFNLLPELSKPENLLCEWKHGLVHVTTLDKGLTHYVTKYHVTSNNRNRNLNIDDDRINEFTIASNKPINGEKYGGIGWQYIKNTKEYHLESGNTFIRNNGFVQRMPSYYYRHIFADVPSDIKEEMRNKSIEQFEIRQQKEHDRLRKLGYTDPEREILRRNVLQCKDVVFKAKKKGVF